MNFPFLFRKEIKDQYVQTNFARLGDYFRDSSVERCQFVFFEVSYPAPVAPAVNVTLQTPHNLTFVPKDVIVMHNSTNAGIIINWQDFTNTVFSITSDAATTLRLLVGRYA